MTLDAITRAQLQQRTGSERYIYLPAMVAAIGGLLFGFDTAVINGAIVFIKREFMLSDSKTEVATSALLLGCVVGASLAVLTSGRFGRKKTLLGAAALFAISSIGAAIPRNLIESVEIHSGRTSSTKPSLLLRVGD